MAEHIDVDIPGPGQYDQAGERCFFFFWGGGGFLIGFSFFSVFDGFLKLFI